MEYATIFWLMSSLHLDKIQNNILPTDQYFSEKPMGNKEIYCMVPKAIVILFLGLRIRRIVFFPFSKN